MKINKKNLKTIVFLMALAVAMLLPANSFAQQRGGGGLFGLGDLFESDEWFRGMLDTDLDEGNLEGGLTNADFGEDAPLGSGLVILLGAGLGYVALKKKEGKQ